MTCYNSPRLTHLGLLNETRVMALQEKTIIEVKDLKKVYKVGTELVFALNGVSLQMRKGEFCAIVGTSGSGKSTLLNMLAGLEPPSKGEISINGQNIVGMTEGQLVSFRRQHIGFVFQSFNLIPSMKAWENVALPLTFRGFAAPVRKKMAIDILCELGLEKHIDHRPQEMSGGQQQRVAIARALVVQPEIVFADEPTGNLDSRTGKEIMELIQRISREKDQTLVMVTHDDRLAAYADRIFRISDGKIIAVEEGQNRHETDQ